MAHPDLRTRLYARWVRLCGDNEVEISPTNPLPVTVISGGGGGSGGTVDQGEAGTEPWPITGTVDTTSADGAHVTLGTTTDPEASGDGTVVGLLKRLRSRLDAIITALGGTLTVSIAGTPTVNVTEPVSVDDNGGSLTVDGTVTVQDGGGTLSVDDGGGSVTVDGTVAVTDGGGSLTVDGAVAINNFPAVQPVSDNGGSLTVDGTVGTTSTDGAHATLGTTTDAEASGDGTVVSLLKRLRSRLDAIITALAGTLTVSITGTPTVNVTEPVSVDDNGGSLTVDDGGGSVTVDGTVTVQDGGGSVSVDDNGGSLTVDGTVATTTADGADVALGATGDSAASSDTGTFSLISLFKRLLSKFTAQFPAALTGSGNFKVSIEEGSLSVTVGDKANDDVPPGANNLGVLPAVATASDPSYTEGNQVALSIGLDGRLRTDSAGSSVITDIEDGAGDSIMNATLNAAQVQVVNVPDGADEALGTTTDAEASGDGTVVAILKRLRSRLDAIITALAGTLTVSISGTPTVNVTEPVSVDDNGGSLTVDDGGTTLSIDDGGGSLTVDGTVTVQDGGGSITVDGTVSVSGAVDTELTTADLDTGAGTDTRAVVGMVLAESGGGQLVGSAHPLPVSDNGSTLSVDDGGGSVTVDGTVTVQDGGNVISIDDAGGSVTVDGTVTVQDGGGSVSVDDGGGSLTVDGTVAVSGAVDTELTTADLDTGAGTDTRAVVGMVLAASGGGVLVGAANPVPISDNGGSLTVDGTVTVTDGGGTISVDDGGGSVTVDGTVSVSGAVDTELTTADVDTGGGTDTRAVIGLVLAESGGGLLVGSAHPMPVSDNGGAISVDDNGATLSVDDGAGSLSIDDGGGSLTVDGTVAVTQSTSPWVVGDGGGSLTVDGTVATTVADGADVALGAMGDSAASSDAGTFSLISLFKRLLGKFTTQFPAALSGSGNFKTAVVEAITAGDNLIGRVKVSDGTSVASVRDLTSSNPIDTAIVDADGNQITSFGGGTQYTEGDTDTSITGTALMWEDEDDELVAASADKPLPVTALGGADTAQFDGIETAYVHDLANRRLLEEVLEELREIKERMFAE